MLTSKIFGASALADLTDVSVPNLGISVPSFGISVPSFGICIPNFGTEISHYKDTKLYRLFQIFQPLFLIFALFDVSSLFRGIIVTK